MSVHANKNGIWNSPTSKLLPLQCNFKINTKLNTVRGEEERLIGSRVLNITKIYAPFPSEKLYCLLIRPSRISSEINNQYASGRKYARPQMIKNRPLAILQKSLNRAIFLHILFGGL